MSGQSDKRAYAFDLVTKDRWAILATRMSLWINIGFEINMTINSVVNSV